MASLADIRARLAAQENKSNRTSNDGEGPVYPHWNINEGDTAILRFLEDGNPDNPYFWVERTMFKFPFIGIKGDPTSREVVVQVPCMEMYGEKDAVLDEVRTWFKDTSLEEMGRKYWKKRTYLFQGFVRQDPMNADSPENPIRRFMISPQIFTLIKNSLMDPELENLPTDKNGGLDFRVVKTSKGGYADYSNSSWARKESALTDDEIAAIGANGLSNLADFLPPKPSAEVQKIIQEMFEASVEGEPYDADRWGAYFTPPGLQKRDTGSNSSAEAAAPAEAAVESTTAAEKPSAHIEVAPEAVVETPAVTATTQKTDDILAMIRSRQK
jgi:hypothetical protein